MIFDGQHVKLRDWLTSALRLCALSTFLVAPIAGSQAAQAQRREPFGVWQGERRGTYLAVNHDWSCSASLLGDIIARCEWRPNPDRSGGMLTMYYTWLIQPGRIRWNLLWLNRNTLLINGVERFVRR